MKQVKIKRWLMAPFFLLLFAPLLQDNLHIFNGGELKGAYTLPDNITFNFPKWFSAEYPEKKGEYLSSCFGFRPDFVRLHNQLKYWLFGLAHADHVIIGKENYLYEQIYIDEYFGDRYVGEEQIINTVRDLKELQDTLAARGVFLFTVFAPGKAAFYPEYLPDNVVKPKPEHSNYPSYISRCKEAGVNFVDCQAWFRAMKDTSRFPLFPKGGVHWSNYGDLMAFDSIVRYVEMHTGKDLPDLILDSIHLSTNPLRRDQDAVDGMNLIFPMFSETLAYPDYRVRWQGKERLSLLTVADSFFWEMYNLKAGSVFSAVDFWYYFNDPIWSNSGHTANKHDMKQFVAQHDVVCLMYTDAGLANFGSGFIQAALYQFKNYK